jgi:hypothetical protein
MRGRRDGALLRVGTSWVRRGWIEEGEYVLNRVVRVGMYIELGWNLMLRLWLLINT